MFFDREPDETGLSHWTRQLTNGKSREFVINGFINSVEWANLCLTYGITSGGTANPTITVTPGSVAPSSDSSSAPASTPAVPVPTPAPVSTEVNVDAIRNFVVSLYNGCLGRYPDDTGLEYWTNKIASGEVTGKRAAEGFFYSREFLISLPTLTAEEVITRYYLVFLGRYPDADGMNYWRDVLINGGSADELFAGFADSQEFSDICQANGVPAGPHINVRNVQPYWAPYSVGLNLMQESRHVGIDNGAVINSIIEQCNYWVGLEESGSPDAPHYYFGGKTLDFKYKDCKKEMDMINKAFIQTMIEGDANGRGFQYPIPTYSITRDFDWSDTENNRLLFEMTSKYGTPYFSNYVNSDMEPSDVRSMCCRLRLDLRELRKKSGGYFGSGESTGSVGVVTINLPRIAYLASNEDDFFKRLNRMMDIAARSLKMKREVITKLLNEGLYPYTKRYLGSFDSHFSTIGLIGMNEVGLNANWLREDLTSKKTQEFAKKVLNHMRERLSDYQEKYGDLYNLEATPAESTTYRLAKHDKKRWPAIKTAGKVGDTPYYTNSSHLPVDFTADIFDALDIQDDLQTLYTSGTVFHAFLGEKLPDWKAAANLVKTIAWNYKLPYYTMSPTYSICKEHGYIAGEVHECPKCGKVTEVYSRITGYYRPVANWNDGKLQEYANRKTYDIENSVLKRPVTSVVTLSDFESPNISVKVEQPENIIYLFTTKTCPNCKLAKEYLKDINYILIDAEENMELATKYGVMQAPTLVIIQGDQIKKFVNASRIKAFVDSLEEMANEKTLV